MSQRFVNMLAVLTLVFLTACATKGQDVRVTQTGRGVEISSANAILFDSGKYNIKPKAANFLDQVATILKTKTKQSVLIEGHTDNVGAAEFNQELSEMRSLSVMKALVDRGVPKNRMKSAGYGERKPAVSNSDEGGRSLNRRTDIVILGEKKENIDVNIFQGLIDFGNSLFQ